MTVEDKRPYFKIEIDFVILSAMKSNVSQTLRGNSAGGKVLCDMNLEHLEGKSVTRVFMFYFFSQK